MLVCYRLIFNSVCCWTSEIVNDRAPSQALSEDDLICVASGPSFSTLAACHQFLKAEPSNMVFSDRVLFAELTDGSLYRVLTGAAGYANHYLNIRKGGPNAVLKVVPSAGISDALVEMRVSTRRESGGRNIASNIC